MPSGRKSLKEEIGVLQRYSDLAPKYFAFIKQMLDSKNKKDQMWAAERLDKAFAKMVPQTINGEGEDGEIIIKIVKYGGDNNPPPIPAERLSTTGIPGTW